MPRDITAGGGVQVGKDGRVWRRARRREQRESVVVFQLVGEKTLRWSSCAKNSVSLGGGAAAVSADRGGRCTFVDGDGWLPFCAM